MDARQARSHAGAVRKLLRATTEPLPVSGALLPDSIEAGDIYLPSSTSGPARDRLTQTVINRLSANIRTPGEELGLIFSQLSYLGPLRAMPARFYQGLGAPDSGVGSTGEAVAPVLYWHPNITADVNGWLETLDVPYSVRVERIGDASGTAVGDLLTLILTDRRSGVDVSPKDVGFGISQLLPIVVHLLSSRECVTCIEQPEIHVHPKLQTELAELLIHATGDGYGNQVIVETHSEHLMLRIQRRIRSGTLAPDHVSIVYVDATPGGEARVRRLHLDEDGSFIDEWPHGFFSERMDELFGGDE